MPYNIHMAQHEPMTQVFRRYFVAALAVVAVLVFVYALYRLRWVALLFAIAGLLSYLLAWPIQRLTRRWSRPAAVWTVFVGFIVLLMGLFGLILPVVSNQVQDLLTHVPDLLSRLDASTAEMRWQIWPGRELVVADYFTEFTDEIDRRIPEIAGNVLSYTQSLLSGTAAFLLAILIVPLMTLYLLMDSQRLRKALVSCFAEHWRRDVEKALVALNRSLGSYIYSRVLLALFVGLATTVLLLAFQIDYALLLGLFAFAGEFVPVLGPWLAYVPITVVVLATEPFSFIWITIIFLLIQVFENYWLAPRWMGGTMDLHPLTIILSLLIGAALAGIAGVLVAVPAAAALKVIFNIFIFRRQEPGIEVPPLDLISNQGSPDIREHPGAE